jgi:uncharacterized membrane protein
MRGTETETGRLEAFSDGVFAVAITLLALDLSVPATATVARHHGLAAALLAQWPVYLAYVLSFGTILIMWINHHAMFKFIKRADHPFLLMNGLLLLIITAFPFGTSLLAAYIEQPDKKVAMVVYSSLGLLMAITYNRMWAYAVHGGRLLDAEADRHLVASISRSYSFGPPLYLAALVVAFLSAEASLAVAILLALFYTLPSTVIRAIFTR